MQLLKVLKHRKLLERVHTDLYSTYNIPGTILSISKYYINIMSLYNFVVK